MWRRGWVELSNICVFVSYMFTDEDTIKFLNIDGKISYTHYKSLIVK